MAFQSSTLRPGLLVSLKTTIRGNVKYDKRVIEGEHTTNDGGQLSKWETERTISNAAEYEAAQTARGKAGALIRGVCAKSAFGLLCPEIAADNLDKAIADARKIADDFNSTAQLTQLAVYVMTGRIAPDDVEAVKAINSEVRDLMQDMEQGLRNLDVKVVREAAGKAKQLGEMLSPNAAARIQIAIETARSAARQIVKAGEQGSVAIDTVSIRKIAESRTSFLDLDEVGEVAAPREQGRGVDWGKDNDDVVSAPAQVAAKFEL